MSIDAARPTINDVAERAGVSRTTVSNALNGKGTIGAETIERVKRVADELGYEPNAMARGLRQSKLGVISLLIRPLESLDTAMPEGVDYFLRFAGSAALAAMDHGYSLMLISDPTKPGAPPSSLAADGCLVEAPIRNDPALTLLDRKRIPFVAVGVDPARADAFPAIAQQTERDTRLALDHLLDAGARRVALVTGTDENSWNAHARRGYEQWAAEHGIEPMIRARDETSGVDGGRTVAHELLTGDAPPDGVYCLTGRHAAGFVAGARELGVGVPDDLLVVAGSDAVMNRTSTPTITALDLRPVETARLAVDALIRLLDGEPVDWSSLDPASELVVRDSTSRRNGDAAVTA
ncbi:LacI family DNA-binding transcriptional regulator [Agromyces sp. S2-1-8]|uniref:LacI family DNA-binding transcriptional regulator n=1 Tax=Agromyces sp. S2-1-8 TaxID=2897180 RepID=UPI001E4E1049|nr:LacI family DNA-binding transcriptional regulator [Agromyces sp. S2-1-8]MCD5348189.1 LacI family transcriptional regulator [Agromyces sp. S2-1-8]